MNPPDPLLKMQGVTKSFGGTVALRGVSLEVQPGEFHALLGANGAGKSTLVKVIGGVHPRDTGDALWQGRPLRATGPSDMPRLGIGVVYQESTLLPELSVAANFALGGAPLTGPRWIGWDAVRATVRERAARFQIDLDPDSPARSLSVALRKVVEILRAFQPSQKLLVLDEPSAAFTLEETARLMEILVGIKAAGTAILYVTHRLHEIEQIVDRVTVLKDGERVATLSRADAKPARIISLMMGQELAHLYPAPSPRVEKRPLLAVKRLTRSAAFHDVDFEVHAAEIVVFVGLPGHGSVEVARAVYGNQPAESGEIVLAGKNLRVTGPGSAFHAGIGFVSEDKADNVFLALSVGANLTLTALPGWSRTGLVQESRVRAVAWSLIKELNVRTRSAEAKMGSLSGGNQQKVVLGRWLAARTRLLVLLDPTAGVDVGARAEIYRLLRAFADEGNGVLIATSDLEEALGLADTVYAFYRGTVAGVFSRTDRREDVVLGAITGQSLGEVRVEQA